MKPPPFRYHAPESVDEAVAVLAEAGHDGKVLAGGQSLVPMLNMRLASPGHLVDINRITGLDRIEVTEQEVRVGALVRHAALERHTEAYGAHPLLRQALRHVAHPAIRNRGTTVGSIAHADAAGEMPAILVLTDGIVEVVGSSGAREIAAADFFLGPLETTLEDDELAVAVRFGRFPAGTRTAFMESARRHGDYALAGVAAAVTVVDGVIERVRVGLVSVTDVPVAVDVTAAVGRVEPDLADWSAAAEAVRAVADPESDIHASAEYRRMLVGELTARALAQAVTTVERPLHVERPVRDTSRSGHSTVSGHSMVSGHSSGTGLSSGSGHSSGSALSTVRVRVNGAERSAEVEPRRLLSDFLRHDLRLTGTHVGCEHGVCGACTVLVDGQPMRSCLMFAVSTEGHEVTTVEGLCSAPDARPRPDGTSMNPVQQAFGECHGLQCGFCTPGFLTTISAFLDETPKPTEEEAREAISGNLCRCTGYQNIVKSVLRASELRSEREEDEQEERGEQEPAQRHTQSADAEGSPA